MADINYDSVPVPYMRDGLIHYIEHGIPPGSFLSAVIANDLFEAFGRADKDNLAALQDWVRWFHRYAPISCYGSREAIDAWCKNRRAAPKQAQEPD